jgi:signal peptidase I
MNEEKAPILANNNDNSSNWLSKENLKSVAKEIGIFALIAFGVVLPFRMFIAEPYLVDGRSMDPTFATGDYLIVDKFSYRIGTPKRNTVIVFKYPRDTKKSFIKRVIGLPGETVIVNDNTVKIINKENPEGFLIDQSYVVHNMVGSSTTMTLKDDEYFVMGDNRLESYDSRFWGPLNKKFILGEPILQLLPIKAISILPGKDTK